MGKKSLYSMNDCISKFEQHVVIDNAEQNETQDREQNDEEADESVTLRNNETSDEENVQRPNDDNGPTEG